jgi:glycosyltransferase involved in cell wall biosynthesis
LTSQFPKTGRDLQKMSENIRVTVVIPAYNAEEFIEDSVKSCFNQTYRPIETIVVNDGSTDTTANKVKALADTLYRNDFDLKLIDIRKNMGAANALNVGFSNAEGTYICWLSADDIFIEREKIQKQINYIKKNRADWGYFRDYYSGSNISTSRLVKSSYLPRLRILDPLFIRDSYLRLGMLLFRNPINGSSVVIKKKCVETNGQFDPITRNIDGDGDLWMRYSALKLKLCTLKGAPVFYREHGKQTSKRKESMMHGSELTRMRILLTLEKYNKLAKIIRKLALFFPIILKAKQHFERPLVSEFLFSYIVENKNKFNYLLLKIAQQSLKDVKKHKNYQSIDKIKFAEDLKLLMRSDVFADFEATFEKMTCNG